MGLEIERRFVTAEPPPAHLLGDGVQIRQGYLAGEGDVEVRLRLTGGQATLTVKAGTGLERTEVDIPIAEAAAALWPHTAGRRIDKMRHRVPLPDTSDTSDTGLLVAEVDLYRGALAGLCTVEVEFASAGAARAFVAPPWFGREVTDDDRWRNAALARFGVPRD